MQKRNHLLLIIIFLFFINIFIFSNLKKFNNTAVYNIKITDSAGDTLRKYDFILNTSIINFLNVTFLTNLKSSCLYVVEQFHIIDRGLLNFYVIFNDKNKKNIEVCKKSILNNVDYINNDYYQVFNNKILFVHKLNKLSIDFKDIGLTLFDEKTKFLNIDQKNPSQIEFKIQSVKLNIVKFYETIVGILIFIKILLILITMRTYKKVKIIEKKFLNLFKD